VQCGSGLLSEIHVGGIVLALAAVGHDNTGISPPRQTATGWGHLSVGAQLQGGEGERGLRYYGVETEDRCFVLWQFVAVAWTLQRHRGMRRLHAE